MIGMMTLKASAAGTSILIYAFLVIYIIIVI